MPGSEDSMAQQASPASKAGKPALWRLLVRFQWLVIPLLIVAAVEITLRKSDLTEPLWYSRAEAIARHVNIDFAFIGTSKVAVSFVEDIFECHVSAHFGRNVFSLNLGQGYSSPQMHYLGLRNLLKKYPDSFKNLTLFIEAFAGVPLYEYHDDWKSAWINMQPQLLVPLLRYSDLKSFWQTKDTSINDKAYVTAKYLLSCSSIISFRERIREQFEREGQDVCVGIVRWLFRLPPSPKVGTAIRRSGGVKTRPEDIKKVKKITQNYFESLVKRQKILKQWEQSVLADMIGLVKQQGGKVFFVNLPANSKELKSSCTSTHKANQRIIMDYLEKWGATTLTPDFIYSDKDLPDFIHLASSRAQDFTKEMALAYISNSTRPALRAKTGMHYSSRYTGGEWVNGIHKKRRLFFLTVASYAPAPFRTGDRLRFATAGEARVVNVNRQEKNNQSIIFVRVDKPLDPSRDGYPSPIWFLGRTLYPSALSDGRDWRNGILLENHKVFLLMLSKGESVPLQVGDILRFHRTGKATVSRLDRRELPNGPQQVFVQMDRDLDPEADGHPHAIELVAKE